MADQMNQKTSILDRAKKLGERLFTKKNIAIAAPIVGAAAAMASKRVRTTVGEAVKSTGESMGLSGPSKSSTTKPKSSGASKTGGATKTAAAKKSTGSTRTAKTTAKPKAATSSKAKPAAKRSSNPAVKADSGAAG